MLAHCSKSMVVPVAEAGLPTVWNPNPRRSSAVWNPNPRRRTAELHFGASKLRIKALAGNINNAAGDGGSGKNAAASSPSSSSSNTNYVVPLDNYSSSSCITRPLAEILRDLNKRIPDNIIIKTNDGFDHSSTFIPWYHANRMLSFYAPGWCGEIRDVIYSDNGNVTVVYRVTIRGSDGEAHRESTGTVSSGNGNVTDLVAAAEEIAFCRACARFGLGLYLYHEG